MTKGEYNSGNNGDFLRGDVAIISNDALRIPIKDTETLLVDVVFSDSTAVGTYTIDRSGAIPMATGERRLSEQQLASLSGKTPEQAASSIFTLADAYAWLKQEGYETHGMAGGATGFANGTVGKKVSWVEMSTIINTLVGGDYDEEGTILAVTQPDEPGWDMYYISFNYVKTGGVYYITDPLDHLNSSGLAVYRAHTVAVSSLSAFKDALEEVNGNVSNLVTLAAYPLTKAQIGVNYTADPMSVEFTNINGIKYLYRANAAALEEYKQQQADAEKAEAERWAKIAKLLKVSDYGMPAAIGNTTLDYSSAYELVGKEPKQIADSVKTVGDVLQYMIAARFGYNGPSAYTPWFGSGSDAWGFDAPGDDQLRQNYGCCCGGYANTVSYLLQGDYETVGTLRWVGGGNHTISWVFTGGKYYVFDFTQYCSGGNYNNYRAAVTILDRLEDFYDRMPDTYSYFPKSEVVIMVAFESGEAMYPSRWNDPPSFTGLTFPTEAKGKIVVIYQKDAAYGVQYQSVICDISNWNR